MSSSKKRSRDVAGEENTHDHNHQHADSAQHFDDVFAYLLGMTEKTFFSEFFEKKPAVFHRAAGTGDSSFFASTPVPRCGAPFKWSSELMVDLCREKTLCYSTDLNVVRYDKVTKKRVPYQTSGPVAADELQKCFSDGGWSVRFLRPQEHSPSVGAVVELLERVFQCSCGVNSYWTPRNSQGFAPHYDDVDVFLLQLEGSKRWRLYHPPEDVDVLSRHSSEDYMPTEIGQPFLTTVLRAGDVLYMPRGCVHQGDTPGGEDSLHITFSAYQMHAVADLMQRVVSYQIETLAANDVNWRRGVPRSWFRTLGAVNSKSFFEETGVCALHRNDSEARAANLKAIRLFATQLGDALQQVAAIDNGVDQYAVDVLAKCQPPTTSPSANVSTPSQGDDDASISERHAVLVSGHAIRLIMSVPSEAQVYHIGGNSRICLETPIGKLRLDRDFAAAIATLIAAYPTPVAVSSLPMTAFEEGDAAANRVLLVRALLDANVLLLS